MSTIKHFINDLSEPDLQWLNQVDLDAAASQVSQGLPYADALENLHHWAQDYRDEAYCEQAEAARFEADH